MLTPAHPDLPTMRKPLRKVFLVFFILQLTAFSAVGSLLSTVEGVHQSLAHDQPVDHHHHHHHHGLAEIDTSGHEQHAPHQHGCDGFHSIGILVSLTPTLTTLGSRPLESMTLQKPHDHFGGRFTDPIELSSSYAPNGVFGVHSVTTS